VNQASGMPVTFSAGGRGIDQNGDHILENNEGFYAASPHEFITLVRDGQRQTVSDLMQLVRVIQVGIDTDGDGTPDLDPGRVYYAGGSQGGMYGTIFQAIE